MNYWEGYMNWPLHKDWECPFCGGYLLIWGFTHGVCRCNLCHAQFTMRQHGKRVTTPVCLVKPEYATAFTKLWAEQNRPIDDYSDKEWGAAGVQVEA